MKTQKRVIFFWIIVLTLFRGLRWDLGTDWYWYEKSFNELDFSNFYKYITQDDGLVYKNLEAGALLMVLCKKIFGTYTSFLLVSNFIILSIYYKISTFFSNNKPIVCFAGIVTSANFFPVRQDLAVAIFFLGFVFWL
ncbi:EpsG family protein [Segatella copri]|uniref:EpsG family protein n=1 Tax=Segatella copri TaxID=165179 RepID=UPI00294B52A9|nr:EpsG family protein [Segatella copri]WOF93389.1 EpsG family protein [Segatella copri]